MRAIRSIAIFKLGVWTGMMLAASFARAALPSRGDEDSDELSLFAILNGIDLKSRSRAFKGGSLLAWYGGISLDLTDVELAPDATLSVRTLFGGIDIETPPGWRIDSSVKALAGGVDTHTHAEDGAPVLTLEGLAIFGGVSAGTKHAH
jgi:hypothetical protein